MKIIVRTISNEEYELKNIPQLIFTQTADAACDSLSVKFLRDCVIDEIVTVRAYEGDEILFNGYADNQKIKENENGFEIYFFARSSAALLVDNEAEPFTYNMPTAKQLWFTFAKHLGFSCDLPNIQSNEKYEVSKGTSCYGAISQFVSLVTGERIGITPQNGIILLEESKDIKKLNSYDILSAQAVINRSEPLSEICFKKTLSSAGYTLHTKAAVQNERGLSERKQYLNLSSLPQWQRDYAVLKRLKASFEDYRILEITVSGFLKESLYQRFSYHSAIGEYEDYLLTEKKYVCDGNGDYTKLTLKKKMDIKEITYVD